MPRENDLQREVRKSVIRQGGYCHKLTNRFTIGIPDLLIALPPFAPCIVEVKDLGECGVKFNRQLDVTPKQRHELTAVSECYRLNSLVCRDVSFLLVGFRTGPSRWLAILPRHAERLTVEHALGGQEFRKRQVGGEWDIQGLMMNHGNIARLA